jgi:hypothetical protein
MQMNVLAKLNVKNVQRTVYKSPAEQRRAKLLAAIEEQMRVLEAAHSGNPPLSGMLSAALFFSNFQVGGLGQ